MELFQSVHIEQWINGKQNREGQKTKKTIWLNVAYRIKTKIRQIVQAINS